jgi:hypothetical protein
VATVLYMKMLKGIERVEEKSQMISFSVWYFINTKCSWIFKGQYIF